MLKTAFIGSKNFFDELICEWLSEHTDLSLIIWTNNLSWSRRVRAEKDKKRILKRRVLKRFIDRAKQKGSLRAIDELLYYVIYRRFLAREETSKIKGLINSIECHPQRPLSEIKQIMPADIRSIELLELIESLQLDAIFAMCIDTHLPSKLINAPKFGSFLWHEGITPEYRGVYSPFWTILKEDYENLGYTLLKMNSRLDAGEVFVQGKVKDIDPKRDWHSYIGHKAVLDSLPRVKGFLIDLERKRHQPLSRKDAVDGYYSYPTASGLLKIMTKRLLA